MAEGWLFRLRSSLGAQHAVPAWPVERDGSMDDARRMRAALRPDCPADTAAANEDSAPNDAPLRSPR